MQWRRSLNERQRTLHYSTCLSVKSIYNQSWISCHVYVVQNWRQLSIMLCLQHVAVDGSTTNNLTVVLLDTLRSEGDLSKGAIAKKSWPDLELIMTLCFRGQRRVTRRVSLCSLSMHPICLAFVAWVIKQILLWKHNRASQTFQLTGEDRRC